MGFKGKQYLTSAGYKQMHKQKKPIQTITPQCKIYKQYKKMYDQLRCKYTSSIESNAIGSIMARSTFTSRISSEQNRELALLDTDKLISLSIGTLKLSDIRFGAMKLVVTNNNNQRTQRFENVFDIDTTNHPRYRMERPLLVRQIQRQERRRLNRFQDRMMIERNQQLGMINPFMAFPRPNTEPIEPLNPNIVRNIFINRQRDENPNPILRLLGNRIQRPIQQENDNEGEIQTRAMTGLNALGIRRTVNLTNQDQTQVNVLAVQRNDANIPRVLMNPPLRNFLDSDSDDELIEPIESMEPMEPIEFDLSESSASLEITEY